MCLRKPSHKVTQTAVRPADDFEIIQQYNELYMKVRKWSGEFLTDHNKPILPSVLEPQIQRILLDSRPPPVILNDRRLQRHVIEGLVGVAISETLNTQGL